MNDAVQQAIAAIDAAIEAIRVIPINESVVPSRQARADITYERYAAIEHIESIRAEVENANGIESE